MQKKTKALSYEKTGPLSYLMTFKHLDLLDILGSRTFGAVYYFELYTSSFFKGFKAVA